MLRHVTATRYAVPLREGGSLPGIVEADDLGMYVTKMRGAGQGVRVLAAEVLVAGLAAEVGVPVPELVTVELSSEIARWEADEEVQDLLTASVGLNLGMDYLPGAFGYDGSRPADRDLAAAILWLDAFTANVDRTWANPNLLRWHERVWAIDHGAALYFHHAWARKAPDAERFVRAPYDTSQHVLADVAAPVEPVHDRALAALDEEAIAALVERVPDEWLPPGEQLKSAESVRGAYRDHLAQRLRHPEHWLPGGAR
ncbi:HipA family kinase [Marihabitans asiaticum]|nr:HipA family kinase [Marihabitans asiaticum]